eukprot:TRINITY_DN10785_c0_g1_i3.p1 TRINITY_DN10785_c0_g1~~TRINITY_DN10785_c0_g1_i3.p1  ORF type:complete len:277 (-),score=22.30 TRINITY_DN10785_c0_g1_i3:84-821(-)
MNISETAFVTRIAGDDGTFKSKDRFNLRWFTPTNEVPLCGHATLAAATVIFRQIQNMNKVLYFTTKSGVLTATLENDKIAMELPNNAGTVRPVSEFYELIEIITCGLPVNQCYFSEKTGKLLVRLEDSVSREELEAIKPEVEALMTVKQSKVKGIIVTLKGDGNPYDFVSRYFAPWNGIREDPVTGSAHTVLAPYWSTIHGNRKEFVARQCSPRGGDLYLTLGEDKVRVLGASVIVLAGKITIDI